MGCSSLGSPVGAVFISGPGRGYAEKAKGTQGSGWRVRRKRYRVRRKGAGYLEITIGYALLVSQERWDKLHIEVSRDICK